MRRVRTFDLTGQPDKFGGHVLLEAYRDDDVLLGRLVRRMVTVPCRQPGARVLRSAPAAPQAPWRAVVPASGLSAQERGLYHVTGFRIAVQSRLMTGSGNSAAWRCARRNGCLLAP